MTPAEMQQRIATALAARDALRGRPLGTTIASLAAAARRWAEDDGLRDEMHATSTLSPAMVDAVLPLIAAVVDEAVMTELVERELGAGATARPAPDGPALVAHVLASNVPGLALPAVALGCLAGAAVLVKSGRDDLLTAPRFHAALEGVDRELAATVVPVYWRGGDRDLEDVVAVAADVVVATGGDDAVAALRPRVRGRFIAHGQRFSVVAAAHDDVDVDVDVAEAVALDVALYDQRGCLSPHAVYVVGDAGTFARRLAAALDGLGARLPMARDDVRARAAARVFLDGAAWEPGTTLHATPAGTVVATEEPAPFRPTAGRRVVRVHPLPRLDALPALLPRGAIECVGLAGIPDAALVDALRDAGVARICVPGRMQRPTLAWPRGQRAPLGALLGRPSPPLIQLEPA